MEFAHNLASEHLISPLYLRGVNQLAYDMASFRIGRTTIFKEYFLYFLRLSLTERVFNNHRDVIDDESSYNPFKIFPPIHLAEGEIPFDFFDPKTDFSLEKGNPYLSIHLGSYYGSKPTAKDITQGLSEVASYIEAHRPKLPGNHVVGVTYVQLARATRPYGFSLAETPLPSKIEKVIIGNTKHKNSNERFRNSGVALCFQSYDDLIVKFKRTISCPI